MHYLILSFFDTASYYTVLVGYKLPICICFWSVCVKDEFHHMQMAKTLKGKAYKQNDMTLFLEMMDPVICQTSLYIILWALNFSPLVLFTNNSSFTLQSYISQLVYNAFVLYPFSHIVWLIQWIQLFVAKKK